MDTIHGLSNHPGLQHNIEKLGEKLAEYSRNQCDYMDVAACFRQTTEYIVNEFMKEFPECMGPDETTQIDNLLQAGYLTDEQAKVLQDVSRAGDVDAGRLPYSELKTIYDDLCTFLPSFLNWFFHPSEKALPEYSQSAEGRNRRARRRTGRSRTSRMNPRTRRLIVYLVILLVIIIAWSAMLYRSHELNEEAGTADTWNQYFGQEQADAQHYEIGQTWTVEGAWEFTIDDVSAVPVTSESSNPYSGLGGQTTQEYQLLIIDYHYTNLGYNRTYGTELTMPLTYAQIVDSYGVSAQQVTYTEGDLSEPQPVAEGETCQAQQAFLILTVADTASMTYTYPGTGDTAIFDLSWKLEETM